MTRRTSFIKRVWNFLGLHQLSPSLHNLVFWLVLGSRLWPLIGCWGQGPPLLSSADVMSEEVTPLMPQLRLQGRTLSGGVRKVETKHSLETVNDFLGIIYDDTWISKTWRYDPINSPDLSGGCQEDQTSPQYIIVWWICQAWLKTL